MWTSRTEELRDSRGLRFAIDCNSVPATFAEVVRAWQSDAGFRAMFNGLLAEVPFAAYRWETPAVSAATMSQPFQFVVLNNPGLARRPDREAFAKRFHGAAGTVVSFANLGGDAILIVPCPVAELSAYGHLATFVRLAPDNQRHELWQTVGQEMARRTTEKPVWLSTAGGGVSWLHVRLDDQPKYYCYTAYRHFTP